MSPSLRSPRYNIMIESGTLAAGDVAFYNLADIPQCAREIPYNSIVFRNFSSNRYKVEYGDTVVYIGGYEVFTDNEAYGLRSVKITNTSLTTQDDDITVIISREITAAAAVVASITGDNLYAVANGDAHNDS